MMKIVDMKLYTVELPFKAPIVTPKITLSTRQALILELVTDDNSHYFGECNAFDTDWYFDETIEVVKQQLQQWFEANKYKAFSTFEDIQQMVISLEAYPATRSTIIMATYQMFYKLYNITVDYGGTVSGLTAERLQQLRDTQPKRVKVKWSNTIKADLQHLIALAHRPNLVIDGNESIAKNDAARLTQLYADDILYIEEPFYNLTTFNQVPNLPLAIDEKAISTTAILDIVNNYNVEVVVLKPFRLGGLDRVLSLIQKLEQYNVKTVIGGMYEYGLSRYFTAMLAQYATYPGDITPAGYYFQQDIVKDSGLLNNGRLEFNPPVIDLTQLNPVL